MGSYFQIFRLCTCWLICFPSRSQGSPLKRVEVEHAFSRFLNRRESWLHAETTATGPLREQFRHPAEILGILLLIGGDVIRKAIAQLAGRHVAPVAFSFGWISYSFGAILSVWGDGRLLPEPDFYSVVINRKTGNAKRNESWVLGRLTRDLEVYFSKPENKRKGLAGPAFRIIQIEAIDAWTEQRKDRNGEARPNLPQHDRVWWSFLVCLLLQIGLAVAPIFIDQSGNWRILLVTCAGTALAFIHGSLPQWREEKYECSMTKAESDTTFILTRGNGHSHVFVIHSSPGKRTLNFEHLAISRKIGGNVFAKSVTVILAVCWIVLLIAIGGLAQHTWFLLGVGGIGMFHNIYVAGQRRTTLAHGIPLDADGAVLVNDRKGNVMDGLMLAETKQPGLGLALLREFFPGRLDRNEEAWWTKASMEYGNKLEETKRKKQAQAEEKTEDEEGETEKDKNSDGEITDREDQEAKEETSTKLPQNGQNFQ